mmetsp:Transcript_124417/g.215010  ORF Transcript_124417/g.215010 Transcript_124417/m.215010 type:complete len:275 (+) Transcript_124417:59-883(+)
MSQNIFEDNLDDSDSAWSRREAARLKQIQIGKARPEYQRYVREVPPNQRQASHPRTPDPRARVSKRQFDRALGDWRRRLHEFDSVPRRVHDYDAGLWSPTSPGSHKKSSATGAGGSGNRVALNDGRGSAAGVNGQRSSAPRRTRARESKLERSVGKSGGRKPAESQEDSQPQQQQELQQQLQQQLPMRHLTAASLLSPRSRVALQAEQALIASARYCSRPLPLQIEFDAHGGKTGAVRCSSRPSASGSCKLPAYSGRRSDLQGTEAAMEPEAPR